MFFPLGLGFKTKTFPFVTWLIILSCSLFYYFVQNNRDYERQYMSLQEHHRLEEAHDYLFYEYCRENLENGLCERFALERGLLIQAQDHPPFQDFSITHSSMSEFAQLYEEFLVGLEEKSKEVRSLPSFSIYQRFMAQLESKTQNIRERHNLLHHDNLTVTALFMAVFSHENLMHLIGNMLFLFIFGRYVEARMGHLPYFLSYLLLGAGALGLYTYMNPQPFLHILGASANVSVVMGAFYALFYHHKLKIFFFYIGTKVAEFPVKTYMFFFFMLQEFVFSMTSQGNVAYFAHALGLGFGMAAGFVWGRLHPVPRDFLYVQELEQWNRIKEEPDRSKFMEEALDIIKHNPNNKTVTRALARRIAPASQNILELDLNDEILLRELMPSYLWELYQEGEFEDFYQAIERIPHSWSMSACLRAFTQKDLLGLIDKSIDEERLMPTVLFIQAFVERYKKSPKVANLLKTLKSVLDHMSLNEDSSYHLKKIKNLSSSKRLKQAIHSRLIEEG